MQQEVTQNAVLNPETTQDSKEISGCSTEGKCDGFFFKKVPSLSKQRTPQTSKLFDVFVTSKNLFKFVKSIKPHLSSERISKEPIDLKYRELETSFITIKI